jgi:ferric-dicitrate binding protein FerR (iron transport regulator)
MAVISVPKTPKKAYDPRRPAGTLLQNQLRHLEWAVRPAGRRTPKAFKKIKPAKTEAEAAARIEKLTRELQRQAALPAGTIPPATPAVARPVRRKTGKTKAKPPSRRPSQRRASR